MPPDLIWRAVMDDGTIVHWDDDIEVNGTVKKASFDDIDRTKLSNLLTVNSKGEVLHSLGFSQDERATKLAVWRAFWLGRSDGTSPLERRGALAGYNQLFEDGHTELSLDFISNEGEIMEGTGSFVELHTAEVFSKEEVAAITAKQEEERLKTETDNDLLANPVPVETELIDGLIPSPGDNFVFIPETGSYELPTEVVEPVAQEVESDPELIKE